VGSQLAKAGARASILVHSGKQRARETAELLGPSIGARERTQRNSGIDPNDATEPFAREVERWTADAMVVGHLPFMSRLVSRLVAGDEETSTVGFHAGTAVCLEREGAGTWSIAWVIHPDAKS
jgi:phosphohistidine phosphatase